MDGEARGSGTGGEAMSAGCGAGSSWWRMTGEEKLKRQFDELLETRQQAARSFSPKRCKCRRSRGSVAE